MTEPGPLRGTPPRLCTMASKAFCRFCGMLSRVAVGILAILPLLPEDCCWVDTEVRVYCKDATASSAPGTSGLTAAQPSTPSRWKRGAAFSRVRYYNIGAVSHLS